MVPIRQELRIAARSLRRAPLFAGTMVLTIALGIGANTAVFSVTNAVLLQALPFTAPHRLVWIASVTGDQPNYPFSVPEFLDYRAASRAVDTLIAFSTWSAIIGGSGPAERLQGIRITANAFDVLGAAPAAGRLLRPADDGSDAANVAVVSFDTWQRRFGGRQDAIGTMALLNGEPFEIVGVLPRHFPLSLPVEVAVPLAPDRDPARALRRSVNALRVIGRLGNGATPQQAEAELNGIASRLRDAYPDAYATKIGVTVRPLHDYLVRNHARGLALLMLAVAAALVVACGNLVNLLLARAAARASDVRVRIALGASLADIARAICVETSILVTIGGAAGIAIGWWTLRTFIRFGPPDLPRVDEVSLDLPVLGYSALVMVTVAAALTLAPLWATARHTPEAVPQTRDPGLSRRSARVRQAVIVAETALTLVLLLAAALLLRSFDRLQDVDPGFPVNDRIVARIALPRVAYGTPESVQEFAERFREELARIPGVTRAGGVNVAPLSGVLATIDFTVLGRPPDDPRDIPSAHYRVITDGYLDALGVPLLRGRTFTERDSHAATPVALVNRQLAEAIFGSDDPIGSGLRVDDTSAGFRTLQIVGVVGDVRQTSLDVAPAFEVYVPMRQAHPEIVQWLANNQFWVIQTSGPIPDIAVRTRNALEAVDAGVGVAHVRALSEYVDAALVQRRFATALSAGLATIALVLVIVGLYGVIAYSVSQRTREIGLRSALGANRADVWWLVTRTALGMLATGAVLGLLLAAPALRPLNAVLFATRMFDPPLVAGVLGALAIVGFAAAAVPAWRAARIDPAIALRE